MVAAGRLGCLHWERMAGLDDRLAKAFCAFNSDEEGGGLHCSGCLVQVPRLLLSLHERYKERFLLELLTLCARVAVGLGAQDIGFWIAVPGYQGGYSNARLEIVCEPEQAQLCY